jgi:hypothetical protein
MALFSCSGACVSACCHRHLLSCLLVVQVQVLRAGGLDAV